MKKIVVIACVKNESDIIESFCRYNLLFSDLMLIYEKNKSSDNTREIIQKLIEEGLPVFFEEDEDLYYETAKNVLLKRAIDKYGADLVIPLDADEFLCHTDGINPRSVLESLSETIEYQAIWRTYIYEKDPDIKSGFMPNNFKCYRNPEMENPDMYGRHKKVFASRFLIENKIAALVYGAHFLVYPDDHKDSTAIEIMDNLVIAHFPIRSKYQVMSKVIPNWINKWNTTNYYGKRHVLDAFQLGVLFNKIKDTGDIPDEMIEQYSIEYAMMLDANTDGDPLITSREELDEVKHKLGDKIKVNGQMNILFCEEKLNLQYTEYKTDTKQLWQATLRQINETVTLFVAKVIERNEKIHEMQSHIDHLSEQINSIYNSRSWKIGNRFIKILKFFIPGR